MTPVLAARQRLSSSTEGMSACTRIAFSAAAVVQYRTRLVLVQYTCHYTRVLVQRTCRLLPTILLVHVLQYMYSYELYVHVHVLASTLRAILLANPGIGAPTLYGPVLHIISSTLTEPTGILYSAVGRMASMGSKLWAPVRG